MGVILFGATGMVGQRVLRECPRDGRSSVCSLDRAQLGRWR